MHKTANEIEAATVSAIALSALPLSATALSIPISVRPLLFIRQMATSVHEPGLYEDHTYRSCALESSRCLSLRLQQRERGYHLVKP